MRPRPAVLALLTLLAWPAAGPAYDSPTALSLDGEAPASAAESSPAAAAAGAVAATATATPAASVQALSAPPSNGAWRLRLPGRNQSPLVLPGFLSGTALVFPVQPAANYGGLGVAWNPQVHLLSLSLNDKVLGRLELGEAWLYVAPAHRQALAGPLRLVGGAPCLDAESLRAVLLRLCPAGLAFESPSPDEAAAALAMVRPHDAPPDPSLEPTDEPEVAPTPPPEDQNLVAARPLNGRRIRTIVIDPGHGGEDPGAHGPHGLREKDVCLAIALRVKAALSKQADLTVLLTRDSDVFIPLRGRTEFANKADADLFVSIHNNASPDPGSHGSQVFFYDSQTSDRAATDLVARENENGDSLDVVLTDLAKTLVRDQSIRMAQDVQGDLGTAIKLKRRHVSYAPFFVLARTKMPAILVEVAFITNPTEERLLKNQAFQEKVAESLAAGLVDYRREMDQASSGPHSLAAR
jgi:N-acetylmuramoyl-L-alanine amidase